MPRLKFKDGATRLFELKLELKYIHAEFLHCQWDLVCQAFGLLKVDGMTLPNLLSYLIIDGDGFQTVQARTDTKIGDPKSLMKCGPQKDLNSLADKLGLSPLSFRNTQTSL